MKDLKHLIFFENLLLEANNELVRKAQADGKVCVAYTCENTPEPLLNLEGCFSARLRAPRTGSLDMKLTAAIEPWLLKQYDKVKRDQHL